MHQEEQADFSYVYTWGTLTYCGHPIELENTQELKGATQHTVEADNNLEQPLPGWYLYHAPVYSNPYARHMHNEPVPRVLEAFDMKRIVQVSSSNFHTLALSECLQSLEASGKVYAWGQDPNTQFYTACPSLVAALDPVFVKIFFEYSQITASTAGSDSRYSHSAALTDTGAVYTWGWNPRGQLGINPVSPTFSTPQLVATDRPITQLKCGEGHTILLDADSEVHVWGFCGQLHTHVAALSPIALRSSSTDTQQRVIRVDAGGYGFCAALTSSNTLYTWAEHGGISEGDFLGHNSRRDMNRQPLPVKNLGDDVEYFACGWIHAAATTKCGDMYTWGDGDTNRLGHGGGVRLTRHKHIPTPIENMRGSYATQFSLTRGNEAAVAGNGDLFVWGGVEHGGHHSYAIPTKLEIPTKSAQELYIKDVSCGKFHTTLLLASTMKLKHLCIRAIAQNVHLLPDVQYLPLELREAIAFYLKDRKKLTEAVASVLGVAELYTPPPRVPTSLAQRLNPLDQHSDGDEDDDEEYAGLVYQWLGSGSGSASG